MAVWAVVFLALTAPLAVMVIYYDLRYMRIPNYLVLLTAIAFVATGPFLLEFSDFAYRAALGLFILFLGFLLHLTGRIGGGDIKYMSAILPFVARSDYVDFVFILCIFGILGVLAHRSVKWLGLAPDNWVSWQRKGAYPYGLTLGAALITYLALTGFMVFT